MSGKFGRGVGIFFGGCIGTLRECEPSDFRLTPRTGINAPAAPMLSDRSFGSPAERRRALNQSRASVESATEKLPGKSESDKCFCVLSCNALLGTLPGQGLRCKISHVVHLGRGDPQQRSDGRGAVRIRTAHRTDQRTHPPAVKTQPGKHGACCR